MDDKPSLKGVWTGHMIHLHFWGLSDISGMAEARIIKYCTQVGCIKC